MSSGLHQDVKKKKKKNWSPLLCDLQREQVIGNEEARYIQLVDNTFDLKWQKSFTSHKELIPSAQKA